MATKTVNPTRMELTRLKKKLKTAQRGHKLLKDKRDELMKRFLEVVKENKELRARVEESVQNVHASFTVASALTSPLILRESLMVPKTKGNLCVDSRNIMSVNVPVFDYEIGATTENNFGFSNENADIYPYGFAFTTSELDNAVDEMSSLLPDLIRLAETEKTSQLLADEIEKTRRRVNALEYVMIPDFINKIKEITIKLDENDRGNLTRLMKVKDMMVEKGRQNSPI